MSNARNLARVIVDSSGDINASSLDNVTPALISDKANTSTGAFDLPAGTTAQRPASPENGMTRFNTTLGYPEWYSASASQWVPFNVGVPYSIEYLVIAGGGGGGGSNSGGGGAGGYRSNVPGQVSGGGASAEAVITLNSGVSYTIVVGAGGASDVNGSVSSFGTPGTPMIASTGGGSGNTTGAGPGNAGGSGGGAMGTYSVTQSGGAGTSGQGYAGGNATTGVTSGCANYTGGGGGGAGGAGGVGYSDPCNNTCYAGDGGAGASSNITGSSVLRAGGGGGANENNGRYKGVGQAGGGNGGSTNGASGTSATANSGSGGGGRLGSGGSGVVIIRYAGTQRASGGTVTSSGGYTIHTFTSSGTFTA